MEKDNSKAAPKMMKALVLAEDGSVAVQDVPIPKPRDGEVLVKILAAPINPSDIAFLKGFYSSQKPKPSTPGFEGSGIVVENGGGFIGWSMVNKRVAVTVQNGFNGTYGQYAVANSQEIMPIPSEVSLEHASMSFVNPLTAIVMLNKVKAANVKAIVHTAAASSLGRMMNRLFSSEGIPIINIVRRDEQVELLKKEGAKIVLNSQKEGFEEELTTIARKLNATVCYDAVAGPVTTKILRALPKNSSIEIYGAMAQEPTLSGLEIREILFSNKTIKGFWLTHELKDLGLFSKLKLINKLSNLLGNDLKSVISKEVSLDKFEEGLEHYMNNMTEGKIIVKPWMGYEQAPVVKEGKKEKKEEKKKEEKKEKKEEKKEKKQEKKQEKKEEKKEVKGEVVEQKVDSPQPKPVEVVEEKKVEVVEKQETPTPTPQVKTEAPESVAVKEQPQAQKANEETTEPPKTEETPEKTPEEPTPETETPATEEPKDTA